jgi:hypothetical protein
VTTGSVTGERHRNSGRARIQSSLFSDASENHPIFRMLLAAPSKGISEQAGTEVASLNRKGIAAGPTKEPLFNGRGARCFSPAR